MKYHMGGNSIQPLCYCYYVSMTLLHHFLFPDRPSSSPPYPITPSTLPPFLARKQSSFFLSEAEIKPARQKSFPVACNQVFLKPHLPMYHIHYWKINPFSQLLLAGSWYHVQYRIKLYSILLYSVLLNIKQL